MQGLAIFILFVALSKKVILEWIVMCASLNKYVTVLIFLGPYTFPDMCKG